MDEYKNSIKTACAWCENPIPGTEDYYIAFGNACRECSATFSNIMGGVRGIKDNKYGKKEEYKIRDYTSTEKDLIIEERIIKAKKCLN